MIFSRKIYHFDPYNVFLAIATNIPTLLKTGFVITNSLDILDLLVASLSPPEIKVVRVHHRQQRCRAPQVWFGISMTKTAIPVFICF